MSRRSATIAGSGAILLWALLAMLTATSGHVPPFQLAAKAFGISGSLGVIVLLAQPHRMRALRQPAMVWLLGVFGLFGYHFLYFTALRSAPPVEASLIAFLWPLLIVLFSSFMPGERLRTHHLAGALLGFCGAALIVTDGGTIAWKAEYAFGYAMALLCALTWSTYSVASRLFASVPSDIVTAFCLIAGALSLICHLLLETTVWPSTATQWLAIAGLGLGPVGLAFFLWDHGVKHGDIQVLGAASYTAPLLSTLFLVLLGFSEPTWTIAIACLCITVGAVLAAKDVILGPASTDQ
jgi:drug/metabolite transporter (DMT)-like permease